MSLRLVIDMNLSPDWVPELAAHGFSAVHWSTVGDPKATDAEIMAWAAMHGHIVFTHDLDFGTLLALTHAGAPSVIQLRTRNVLPRYCLQKIVIVLNEYASVLKGGALAVVEEAAARVRVLPL